MTRRARRLVYFLLAWLLCWALGWMLVVALLGGCRGIEPFAS